ncbi:hypothetical protein [Hymenobacter sp. CRA2]|uniref:hypothetical protein n=1 Tax=Hymenobacter sp. CRA2 TaxID=1955620 RepID=UPI00098FBC0B|nr:hypothetical protein [Hymenobacter sp. CRA2]OON68482.1 hypothetical protein B0919_12605 [Hymenobacter sp. CRA2]
MTTSRPSLATALAEAQHVLGQANSYIPKPVSPQTHAWIDLLAFPAMLGLSAWLRKRNSAAAALVLFNALGEGTIAGITDFPPSLLPLISFRNHIRIGLLASPMYLALAALTPGIPWRYRRFPVYLGLVPIVLNSLSNPKNRAAH